MREYPDPEQTIQSKLTEHLDAALTNILYYYNYFKATYISPTIERAYETELPSLPSLTWLWPKQQSLITYQPDPVEDDRDYVNWATLLEEDDEKEPGDSQRRLK